MKNDYQIKVTKLENEIIDLKEKIKILRSFKEEKEKENILNLNSKIIGENNEYNKSLKKWINRSKKIRAELLYRLSENDNQISVFHDLCDNKGPTLTLFYVNDENKVGIYTPLSWDTSGQWKSDSQTFIFNLNKNQKYKSKNNSCSISCYSTSGPCANYFGCSKKYNCNNLKSIYYDDDKAQDYYDIHSRTLPYISYSYNYNLLELEVYQIIIE